MTFPNALYLSNREFARQSPAASYPGNHSPEWPLILIATWRVRFQSADHRPSKEHGSGFGGLVRPAHPARGKLTDFFREFRPSLFPALTPFSPLESHFNAWSGNAFSSMYSRFFFGDFHLPRTRGDYAVRTDGRGEGRTMFGKEKVENDISPKRPMPIIIYRVVNPFDDHFNE
jgi:hypothetical protein